MFFAVFGNDRPGGSELRAQSKLAHMAHLDRGAPGVTVRQSGPILNDHGQESGSLIIVEARDRSAVETFVAVDPYVKANLFSKVLVQQWAWKRGNPYLRVSDSVMAENLKEDVMSDRAIKLIEQLENERYEAMLQADTARLEELLHPGLTYIHSSGVTDTKRSYIEGVGAGKWKYNSVSRADNRVAIYGPTALVFNRLNLRLDVDGVPKTVDARTTAIWILEEDWKLVAVQSASTGG